MAETQKIEEVVVSPALSMQGWSLWTWFIENAKTIKEIAKWLVSYGISFVVSKNPAFEGLMTLLGKLALDSLEYYIKKRTVKVVRSTKKAPITSL